MFSALAISAPEGAALDFTLLFGVILVGPVLVERARVPGIIGLLLGGFLVGPHALGWIEPGNETIPELGQFGLLYLMFGAGLELDLVVLREHRRTAISFGLLTFALPFLAGVGVGVGLGWELPASLLLGSLLASHTLVLYPTVRQQGLGSNSSIAASVGATMLTDTLALVVLAGVAGTATGSGSTAAVLAEVGIGLAVLGAVGFLALPRVASTALHLWGGDRAARYLVALVSFLAMAMLAEVFSIEGIVGAFFAGLALNRILPGHGPSMERIEFNGTAMFIPVFLVSVGLLLDPKVMFTRETLGVAGLICLACIGGKAAAAALSVPFLGFTRPEAGVVFALTTPQAAATLAATLVGFDIGLFGTAVVNAVLVLILVSIVVSTLVVPGFARSVPPTPSRPPSLGSRLLVLSDGTQPTRALLEVAERLAGPDGGIAEFVLVRGHGAELPSDIELGRLESTVFNGCLDGWVSVAVDDDLRSAARRVAAGLRPSLIVVDGAVGAAAARAFDDPDELTVPVVVVTGGPGRFQRVRLVPDDPGDADDPGDGSLLAVVARRFGPVEVDRTADPVAAAQPGDIVVGTATGLAGLARTGADGVVVVQLTVPASPAPTAGAVPEAALP